MPSLPEAFAEDTGWTEGTARAEDAVLSERTARAEDHIW
jgi:hypothetical protein